ncbi:hypothetical protein PHLCEN_2v4944 [Hermanssonia centrifuga]|uniref:Uncharacterized protein n=1 Tax=Hermanssonia centrifuga TaxID=98765 RepID=A0A2R6PCB0_9APHY|nr:hypothetical protein PHLCEN_2v4944 [Hermanssonia centrifuga]
MTMRQNRRHSLLSSGDAGNRRKATPTVESYTEHAYTITIGDAILDLRSTDHMGFAAMDVILRRVYHEPWKYGHDLAVDSQPPAREESSLTEEKVKMIQEPTECKTIAEVVESAIQLEADDSSTSEEEGSDISDDEDDEDISDDDDEEDSSSSHSSSVNSYARSPLSKCLQDSRPVFAGYHCTISGCGFSASTAEHVRHHRLTSNHGYLLEIDIITPSQPANALHPKPQLTPIKEGAPSAGI